MDDTWQQHDRTPETVEREIARTRAELDDTLDVLTNRLSPHEIKERAVDYAKDTASSVGETVQRNPIASAVSAGTLLAMLLWVRRRHARRLREREDLSRAVWERIAAALERPLVPSSHTRSSLANAVDRLGDLAVSARETATHGVSDAMARTRDVMENAATRPLVDSLRCMVAMLEDRSRERPLVALGIAALSGAMLTRIIRR